MLRDDTGASAESTASLTEGTPVTISRGWSRKVRLEAPNHGVECHPGHVDAAVGQPKHHP